MRPFLITIIAISAATLARADLRLFFSPVGVDATTDLSPAQVPVPRENPTVLPGQRLYIWAEMSGLPAQQSWNGISFDVVVDGGAVTGRSIYNYQFVDPDFGDILFRHWGAHDQGLLANGALVDVQLASLFAFNGVTNEQVALQHDGHSEVKLLNSRQSSEKQRGSGAKSSDLRRSFRRRRAGQAPAVHARAIEAAGAALAPGQHVARGRDSPRASPGLLC